MELEIIEAGVELKGIIGNLGQYYIHDLTDFLGFRCPEDGRFATTCWDRYWTEPGCRAFVLKVEDQLAGLVLIEVKGVLPESQFSIGEFFIMRKFRGRGLGQQVAFDMFDRFRGRWEVCQLVQNKPAIAFWRKVIGRYTRGNYHELPEPVKHDQWEDIVQTFDNTNLE